MRILFYTVFKVDNCGDNMECADDGKCRCVEGYTSGSDGTCTDIDECMIGLHWWVINMIHFYEPFLWNQFRCNLETENCINTIGSYDCEIIPLFCEEGFYMDGQICRGNIWRYIFNITYNTEKYKKTSNSVHGSNDFQFETPDRTGPEKTTSGLVKKPKQRFGKMRLNFLSSFDQESVKNIFLYLLLPVFILIHFRFLKWRFNILRYWRV